MGDVSRRAVLGAGASALGLAALGVGLPDAEATTRSTPRTKARAATAKATPMSAPVRADYAHVVGRVFTATRGGHSYRVKLTHLQDIAPATPKQRPHCFALIFAPVGKARLHDGIYVLRRAGVRTHKLFISSVGTERGMQAIINRSH
jgi:hypothetical protein